jgi:DNA-binding HxlR family transcriptional regulator
MPLKTNKIYHIPVEATLDVIGGKWKTLILCHLTHQPKRSGQLKKLMPPITQKMLTQQLKELEADGLITRTVFHEVPLKVVYELSELGWSLKPILYHMCDWGEKLMKSQLSSPLSIK